MKHITYKFTDGSEIDIDDNQTATILGSTEQFAYKIWREVTSRKELPKRLWTAAFIGVADGVHEKHGIVVEHTNHFLGTTVNNFNKLINKTA